MRRMLMAVAVFATVGCSGRPALRIDPTQPFRIEFGRGSGWHGLDTIKIDQGGSVVLHRAKREQRDGANHQSWETTTIQLQPDAVADVVKAVDANNVLGLNKAYHANIHDGTQWVLWIKQGNREKSVYFNNSFPREITEFAKQLDGILANAGLERAVWKPVPTGEARPHEREIWDSIER